VLSENRSGTWNTVKFKPYNFKAMGAPTMSGALHPCMTFPTNAYRTVTLVSTNMLPVSKQSAA